MLLYAVCASKYPVMKNRNRVSNYDIEKFKRKDIEMLMRLKDIETFEKMNYLVLNTYAANQDGSNIHPKRISNKRSVKPINLLMLENGEKYHFIL